MTREEILAKLEELGRQKDAVRAEMIGLRKELDLIAAKERAEAILSKLSPAERDVFVDVATVVAKSRASLN